MTISGKCCNKKQLISPSGGLSGGLSGTLGSTDGEQNIIYNKKKLPNPLRIDPTRTVTLRRSFLTHIRKQWGKLKGRIVKFLIDDDQFGLVRKSNLTKNSNPNHDEKGQFSSGEGDKLSKYGDLVTRGDENGGDDAGDGELSQINLGDLEFPGGFGDDVTPLSNNRDKPIIVVETKTGYRVIDGWGRSSGMLNHPTAQYAHAIIVTKGDLLERGNSGDDEKWNEKMYDRYTNLPYHATTNSHKDLHSLMLNNFGTMDWETRHKILVGPILTTNAPSLDIAKLVNVALKEFEHIWEEEYLKLDDFPKECNTKNFTKIITQYLAVTNEQMRDEKGRFASGGRLLDKATVVAKKVGQKIVEKFTKFKDRYGVVGATAIVAAMLTPVPGIGFATIGVAEGIRAINKLVRSTNNTVLNAGDFAFDSTEKQIQIFTKWLETQIDELIDGATENELWDAYIQEGFKRGIGRAWDDTKQATRDSASKEKLDFYAGTREQFLRSTFHQAVSQERVRVLAGRTFTDLENVTNDMATRIGRSLIDGLIQGDNPRDIAREIDDDLDVGRNRAETIARTEIIRSHASGQLDAMENMGVEELGVMVEWSTAGEDDPTVCPECAEMEGVVLTIDEARGMIPRHPNCRCAFIPANVGEDEKDQTRGKSAVDKAVDKSAELGDDDFSTGVPVTKERPQSVVNTDEAILDFDRALSTLNNNPNHDEKGQFSSGPSMGQLIGSLKKSGPYYEKDKPEEEHLVAKDDDKKGSGIKGVWKAYKDITNPQVKDYVAAALWNANIDPDGKLPKTIPDDAKLVRRLSSAYRDLQEKGNDHLHEADKVLEAHGMRKVDQEGDVTKYDGAKHDGVEGGGVFTGDKVRVVHSGWEKEMDNGIMYQPLKSKVEKVK